MFISFWVHGVVIFLDFSSPMDTLPALGGGACGNHGVEGEEEVVQRAAEGSSNHEGQDHPGEFVAVLLYS